MTKALSAPSWTVVSLLVGTVGVPGLLSAQEPAGSFVWENATELSYVATGGNASSKTLGLKGQLAGTGGLNSLLFEVGGVRAESNFKTRTAVGTASDFSVTETTRSEVTAGSYFARGRYDRSLGTGFVFGGTAWERNTFAGVKNRFSAVSGVGRSWFETEAGHFKTDVGLTYTIQKDVAPAPGADDAFAGWRATADAMRVLSQTTTFTSVLVVDNNLEESQDLRADWINSLSVSINSTLALKTSLQLLWDNQPSLASVPLISAGGVPTGTSVLTPGAEIDSVLTLTLVIKL